ELRCKTKLRRRIPVRSAVASKTGRGNELKNIVRFAPFGAVLFVHAIAHVQFAVPLEQTIRVAPHKFGFGQSAYRTHTTGAPVYKRNLGKVKTNGIYFFPVRCAVYYRNGSYVVLSRCANGQKQYA